MPPSAREVASLRERDGDVPVVRVRIIVVDINGDRVACSSCGYVELVSVLRRAVPVEGDKILVVAGSYFEYQGQSGGRRTVLGQRDGQIDAGAVLGNRAGVVREGRVEEGGVVAGLDGQRMRGVAAGAETAPERIGKGESDGLGVFRHRVVVNTDGEARIVLRRCARKDGHGQTVRERGAVIQGVRKGSGNSQVFERETPVRNGVTGNLELDVVVSGILEDRRGRPRKFDGSNIIVLNCESVSVRVCVDRPPFVREVATARGERKDNRFIFVIIVVGEDVNGYGVASDALIDVNIECVRHAAVRERNHTVFVARGCRKQEFQSADGRRMGEGNIKGR